MTIDLEFLSICHDNGAAHGIPYVWGAKPDPSLTTDQITGSDCSGWARYLFGRQGITLPEGSQEQMEWFKSKGPGDATADYAAVGNSPAGELFICFALDTRASGGHAGHVWFVESGETMECYGGVGVGSRLWYNRVLRRIFHVAFRVPTK
jgi:hypothetical protein